MKEILTKCQRDIISIFSEISDSKKFYFTGGTALSNFYLKHRLSFDVDLFAKVSYRGKERGLILSAGEELKLLLKENKFKTDIILKREHIFVLKITKFSEIVRLNLAFDTASLIKPAFLSKYGIRVASFEDISAAKLSAMIERLEDRDIVDVYFILKRMPLKRLITLVKKRWKFIDSYQVAQIFNRVKYILPDKPSFSEMLLKPVDTEDIRNFFLSMSLKILSSLRKD